MSQIILITIGLLFSTQVFAEQTVMCLSATERYVSDAVNVVRNEMNLRIAELDATTEVKELAVSTTNDSGNRSTATICVLLSVKAQ